MKIKVLLYLAPLIASAQSPAEFERSVRSAMAKSIAQQQASIRKQVAVAAKTVPGASDSFFTIGSAGMIGVLADCDPLPSAQLDPIIKEAAQKEKISSDLVRAVIDEESAARPCAVSFQGAEGLMQLMPATAAEFDVTDPFDPKQNIEAGARFLKLLLGRYGNDVGLALGAYNAGPGRVDLEGGIPQIPETINYVGDILRRLHLDPDKPAPGEENPNP